MQKVINSDQVAHFWANKTQSEARNPNGSMFFNGNTIYSYGSHFPIARHIERKGKSAVAFTTRDYSVTTSSHKSTVASAARHLTVFTVADVESDRADTIKANLADYGDRITALLLKAKRARKNAKWDLEQAEALINEGNQYAQFYGYKPKFAQPEDWQAQVAKAEATAKAVNERKRKQAEIDRKERLEALEQWKQGAAVGYRFYDLPTALRVIGDNSNREMETSLGARVPIAEAEKAFRFAWIQRARGWHRNGEQFTVGHYNLDAVNDQGVVAGCHRVAWPEIERFAQTQGWQTTSQTTCL